MPKRRVFREVLAVFLTESVAQLDQSDNLSLTVPISYALHTRGCDICAKVTSRPKYAILGALKPADFNICRRATRAERAITPPESTKVRPHTYPPFLPTQTPALQPTPSSRCAPYGKRRPHISANANLYGLNTKENKSYFTLNHHTMKNNVDGFFVPLHRKNKVIRLIILIFR